VIQLAHISCPKARKVHRIIVKKMGRYPLGGIYPSGYLPPTYMSEWAEWVSTHFSTDTAFLDNKNHDLTMLPKMSVQTPQRTLVLLAANPFSGSTCTPLCFTDTGTVSKTLLAQLSHTKADLYECRVHTLYIARAAFHISHHVMIVTQHHRYQHSKFNHRHTILGQLATKV
jgi:hypothetical protein